MKAIIFLSPFTIIFLLLISCGGKSNLKFLKPSSLNFQSNYPTKGYALLIGVNEVDFAKYGSLKKHCGAKEDINSIRKNLKSYTQIFVKDSLETTWGEISRAITSLQKITKSDNAKSYVLIYYTGHGALVDNTEQFLCFRNKMVHRNEFRKQLEGFESGTKIYMLTNACYSGGYGSDVKSNYFPENYKKFYHELIYALNDYEFNGDADICYTGAADKFGKTPLGAGCGQSDFTGKYLAKLKVPGINYSSFTYTTYDNDSSFFLRTQPLIFNK